MFVICGWFIEVWSLILCCEMKFSVSINYSVFYFVRSEEYDYAKIFYCLCKLYVWRMRVVLWCKLFFFFRNYKSISKKYHWLYCFVIACRMCDLKIKFGEVQRHFVWSIDGINQIKSMISMFKIDLHLGWSNILLWEELSSAKFFSFVFIKEKLSSFVLLGE